jgi:hypothetical protein
VRHHPILALTSLALTSLALTFAAACRPPPYADKPAAADSGATGARKAATAAAAGGAAATLTGAAGKVAEKAGKVAEKAESAAAETGRVAERLVGKAERAEKAVAEKIGDVLERDPYGEGSIRVTRRSAAPEGYTIKGDKDTMRYFTLESPQYASIEAEVWFANEASAQAAGFLRWDAAAGDAPADTGAAAATTVVTGGDTDPVQTRAVITGGDTDASATAARIVDTSGPDRPGKGGAGR